MLFTYWTGRWRQRRRRMPSFFTPAIAEPGAHLAIVLTSARELWPLLVVQSWQLGGFAIYALGILPFTVLIVAAPLLRDRVQQKRSAVESILPGDARLPA